VLFTETKRLDASRVCRLIQLKGFVNGLIERVELPKSL